MTVERGTKNRPFGNLLLVSCSLSLVEFHSYFCIKQSFYMLKPSFATRVGYGGVSVGRPEHRELFSSPHAGPRCSTHVNMNFTKLS